MFSYSIDDPYDLDKIREIIKKFHGIPELDFEIKGNIDEFIESIESGFQLREWNNLIKERGFSLDRVCKDAYRDMFLTPYL